MPLVKVIRKGVTPSVRKVPTSTAAVMLPMTLNKIGKEAASENEELSRVEDVNDAFAKFKPELNFKGNAGPEETEFKAEFKFKSIKDFDPENLQKRQEFRDEDGNVTYARNDLADLKANIDLLYRLKDRWKLPTVRRAWNSETQRAEIIQALGRLKEDLTKLSGKEGK
jgi:predicted component of type VI protein secretion system